MFIFKTFFFGVKISQLKSIPSINTKVDRIEYNTEKIHQNFNTPKNFFNTKKNLKYTKKYTKLEKTPKFQFQITRIKHQKKNPDFLR